MTMKRMLGLVVLAASIGLGCANSSSSKDTGTSDPQRIGNVNTKVFHTTDCYYVQQGLVNSTKFATREAAIAAGYTPDASGKCHP